MHNVKGHTRSGRPVASYTRRDQGRQAREASGPGRPGRHRRLSTNRALAYSVGTLSVTVFLLGARASLMVALALVMVVLAVAGAVVGSLRGAEYLGTRTQRSSFRGSLSPRRRGRLRWWQLSRRWARWSGKYARRWHAFEQRRAANRYI